MTAETMRVGLCDNGDLSDENLTFARQLGLTSVRAATPRSLPGTQRWEYEDLKRLVDRTAAYGLKLEVIENTPTGFFEKVMLGQPGRDEQIEHYCATIRNMGRAGIPILGHNWMPNFVWRTSRTTEGRGGAHVTAFDMALVDSTAHGAQRAFVSNQAAVIDDVMAHYGETQVVTDEDMWANYEYFIRAVLPVAEVSGVRLALHPDDPPVPSLGGVARIFRDVAGFQKGYALASGSPAWGLDLCLGCCSEMSGGAVNVREMIEFFGPRGSICYVHFRDVQGTVPKFAECFLGEGNYDPAEIMLLLRKSGFTGFVLDDHVPHIVGDTAYGHRARAHAIGYMQGLLRAIETLGV
jgi:mannonate dehydratase